MRIYQARLGLFLLTVGSFYGTVGRAAEIWVITDESHPVVVRSGVRLIELDAPKRIQRELTKSLPADGRLAAQILRERLGDPASELNRRLSAAYQAVVDAWSLGITAIPAVVVDRKYVVYGDPNVEHACALIKAFREEHP